MTPKKITWSKILWKEGKSHNSDVWGSAKITSTPFQAIKRHYNVRNHKQTDRNYV